MNDDNDLPLEQRLNLETGKIAWPELQRFFARGVIIVVSPSLDLIDIAKLLVDNQSARIEQLINDSQLLRATDEHALDWQARDPVFWGVVVAPWVLIQEISH